ncbi:MAG: hypothetical protein EPN84_07745 [Legionella sp.]|nr:MAG: hypothetical protein EPN84_07745 [Legionella sp.]
MRSLIPLVLALLSSISYAESTFPKGCQPMVVQGQAVTIQAKKNKLIFIHNLAGTDLWITHPVTDPSASAGWTTRLQAGNWSALAVDKGPFELSCIESRPGHEQQIPCEGSIAVCKWKGVKFPKNDEAGTYWAAEDKSLDALTAAVGSRGFVIPIGKTNE